MSKPINTIFRGMTIHLPSYFDVNRRGIGFWPTATCHSMRVFVTDLDFVWNKRHLSSALKSWSMNGEKTVSHTNMLKTTLRSTNNTNIALEYVTFRPIKTGDFPDQIVGLPEGSGWLQGPLGEIPARLALLLFTCNDFGLWRIPEDVKKRSPDADTNKAHARLTSSDSTRIWML